MTLVQKMFRNMKLPKMRFRKLHQDEKGLTLIELLAVIVILGIVAAIAIPAISGILENSERKAQMANAQVIIDSARLAIADRGYGNIGTSATTKIDNTSTESYTISIQQLVDGGFINSNSIDDPYVKGTQYHATNSLVQIERHSTTTNGVTTEVFKYYLDLAPATGSLYYNDTPESDI
ncbi:type II secretion system protein [Marinicrinis sediminis]|uniref:Type II secretion system protein n=1 Tax=Marinicrinis sediminis TaxID=1652465 RepID=A0ABW5RCL4_9BACL